MNCPECHQPAREAHTYLSDKRCHRDVYRCDECNIYVERDANGKPYGQMVSDEVHYWRGKAYMTFNPLWKIKAKQQKLDQAETMREQYQWLWKELEIEENRIGMMDIETCKRVVALCAPEINKIKEIGYEQGRKRRAALLSGAPFGIVGNRRNEETAGGSGGSR